MQPAQAKALGLVVHQRGEGFLAAGRMLGQGDGGIVLPRPLGNARVGDLLVIHNTGAYGASMSSNYNSRPLAAEVLVDGEHVQLIRRRQTVEELLALELSIE